jgi:hypothetical protein
MSFVKSNPKIILKSFFLLRNPNCKWTLVTNTTSLVTYFVANFGVLFQCFSRLFPRWVGNPSTTSSTYCVINVHDILWTWLYCELVVRKPVTLWTITMALFFSPNLSSRSIGEDPPPLNGDCPRWALAF